MSGGGRFFGVFVGVVILTLMTAAVHGQPARYPNGAVIQSGDRAFYPTGALAAGGGRVFYPTGALAYANGRSFYPNGALLSANSKLFYSRGQLWIGGGRVFYSNGALAASDGGRIFYENGTRAAAITIRESLGAFGQAVVKCDAQGTVAFMTIELGQGYAMLVDVERGSYEITSY